MLLGGFGPFPSVVHEGGGLICGGSVTVEAEVTSGEAGWGWLVRKEKRRTLMDKALGASSGRDMEVTFWRKQLPASKKCKRMKRQS